MSERDDEFTERLNQRDSNVARAAASEVAHHLATKLFEEKETKRIFKEAMTEWMDKKFIEFGTASVKAFMVVLFAAVVVFVMWTQGYHK